MRALGCLRINVPGGIRIAFPGAAIIAALALAMLPGLPPPTRGATVTWTGLGATTNWNLGANWSTGTAPGSSDIAAFDGTSSKAALVNANVNIGGIAVSAAYGGTITQAAGRTITVGASGWTQSGSTFAGSAAAITVNGPFSLSGGTFGSTSGTLSVSGAFTMSGGSFAHNGGTLRFIGPAAAIDLPGTLTAWDLTLSQSNGAAKTLDPADALIVYGTTTLFNGRWEGGDIAARGPITAAASFDGGDGTLRIDGAGDQLFTGTATVSAGKLPNLVIDKPSGTLSLAGTIRTLQDWTYLNGGLDAAGSTVSFDSGSLISGSHSLDGVVLRGAGSTTLVPTDTLTVTGLLTLTNGTWDGGTLLATGDLAQAVSFDGGTGSLRIGGAGDQLFSGSANSSSGQLPNLVIDKPSGTLSLAGTIRTRQDWTYLNGGLDAAGSTVVLSGASTLSMGGASLDDLHVRFGSPSLGGALVLGGDLLVSSGTLDLAANAVDVAGSITVGGALLATGADLQVAGDLLVTGTLVADASVVTLDGPALQRLDTDGAVLADLVIAGAVGVVLDDDLHVSGTLDIAAGTLTLGARRLTIERPIAGMPTGLVADASSSLTIDGMQAGIAVPASVTDLAELSIQTAEEVMLDGPLALHARLRLDGGNLDAAGDLVRIVTGATVARTSGHVIGTLEKPVTAGGPLTITYEIGDDAGYTPLVARWDVVGIDGTLAASTAAGDDEAALAAMGLVPTASVNRTWSLAPAGLAADPVEVTVTYLADDLDPLADPAYILAVASEGGTSGLPAVTLRSASSATVSLPGIPVGTLGLGMPGSDLAVAIGGAGAALVNEPYSATVTATNLGAFAATAVIEIDLDPDSVLLSAEPSQGSCSLGGPSLVCALGPFAAADTATVELSVTFATAVGHRLIARMATAVTTVDPNDANDVATHDLVVSLPPAPTPEPPPSTGSLPDTADATGGYGLVESSAAVIAILTALALVLRRRQRFRRKAL